MLVIIDHKARSTRGMPINQVQDAHAVIGKDRIVLKHAHRERGSHLTERELDALRSEATEVIERGEPLL